LTLRTLSAPLDLEERVDVSVVMPAYNEAANIDAAVRRTLQALQGTADSYEVVVVDDGSADGTAEKVQALASENGRVRLVRNGRNMGKGVAVKHAAEFVRGDTVVVMDADMEIHPGQLQRYVHALNKYDLCVASKRHPDSVYNAPLMRKLLSIGFNKMVQVMTGVRLADSQTGLKAMRGTHFKRIMKVISVKRYAYDVEVLAVAQLMKLKVAELPVRIEQGSGFGKKAVMFMLVDLLGIAYRLRVLGWYQQNLATARAEYKPVLRI
jgi:glycosyltransferase involved in cell wall biosynthesis